ncbi:assimilatory sulfite reductase (NADPH) hemoprotein subunit [Flavihumibacter profundi]|uniref:assimilatory sulfite reductase (NADPH) hemoprotein subunit n=1 Tax=Flavihumibacter profundi TaxID=2716883 RepID=UPI001CC5976E|nr:assimilatory sulfite reductase (NADPH) hemoprotein subunit [Flavihumibacter profundi]MBZ5856312.1 assimilatory sulfite reductase (NADPH) hemoprotein subunit [Flavihumibacter profundi]
MSINQDKSKLSEVEHIKEKSKYLEGTIQESLKDEVTGNLYAQDQHLIKFHGSYVQSDRELDKERKAQKLEPLYSFMIRVRVPGGIATPAQWIVIDDLATKYGMPTLKLTTRQAFELHNIFKHNLKQTIKEINDSLLNSIAACGDVNRNVMNTVNPHTSAIHDDVQAVAKKVSDHLNPKTTAYYKIWVNEEQVVGADEEAPVEEPIYGKTYLPRKFKITLAIPPYNDTDVFAHDVGLIAIEEKGKLLGFNVSIGGGMGMTFGDDTTYPRLGNVIGFSPTDQITDVCEKLVTIQRDYGNRENRKNSRFKYTIDRLGLDFVKNELNKRLGYDLAIARPFEFTTNGDSFGWIKGVNGKWFNTLYIEGGRVKDNEKFALRKGLRAIAEILDGGDFRLTGNQNVVIGNVSDKQKPLVEKLLVDHGLAAHQEVSKLHQHSIACVALNLCPLANSEAERYLPSLIDKIQVVMEKYGIGQEPITIRMTGCPNGCGRPYLGEIGFVGRAPGKYNLYLGASFNGDRLNVLHKEALSEEEIIATLDPLIEGFAKQRLEKEHFGDFLVRKGIVHHSYTKSDFHIN